MAICPDCRASQMRVCATHFFQANNHETEESMENLHLKDENRELKGSLVEQLAAAEKRAKGAERAVAAMRDRHEELHRHAGAVRYAALMVLAEARAHGQVRHVTATALEDTLADGTGSGWLSPEQGAEKDARITRLEGALMMAAQRRHFSECGLPLSFRECESSFCAEASRALAAHPTEEPTR
jgi:hypothetical protein